MQQIDLTGKVCLITGATSGIGKITARDLAAGGAELFLVCRNKTKGEAAKAEISAETGNEKITLLEGDLAVLSDVRRVAEAFLATGKPLHILLNNAGVVNLERKLTVDGHEEMFAVNHLAHFLLTTLLLDRLKETKGARIVNVASEAHWFAKAGINFDDLTYAEGFKGMKVYGHSKLANILFTRELARRLEGSGVTANAAHPHSAATGLGAQNGFMGKMLNGLMQVFLQSAEKGARTSTYVCTAPELEGVSGKYFGNCREDTPKPWAQDDEAAKRLWQISEQLVG